MDIIHLGHSSIQGVTKKGIEYRVLLKKAKTCRINLFPDFWKRYQFSKYFFIDRK